MGNTTPSRFSPLRRHPSRFSLLFLAVLLPQSLQAVPSIAIDSARSQKDSSFSKYLDCHVHTAGIGAGGSGCFISKTIRGSYKFRIYLGSFGVTEKLLLEKGDGLVLEKISAGLADSKTVGSAVILALDGAVDE